MYLVACSYGTNKLCWNYKTALEWLACCGDEAIIVSVLRFGKIVAERKQIRVY